MLEPLRDAVKRGAQVVCINPLKERGLERFQHPQHPLEMLTNGDARPTPRFRPALGGDMALLRGMAKFLLQWEREAQAGRTGVFDHAFIAEHSHGVDDYLAVVDATPWEQIVAQSGLPWRNRAGGAHVRKGKRVIMCWAMGITQHRHSVPTIQEIVNLMLLRGNIGAPGAGLCPVRGHSNVQGDRTMGINERPPVACSTPSKSASSSGAAPQRPQRGRGDPRHARRPGQGVHRPGRQLRPGHPDTAHRPGAAQLRPDRADQHQAQPQPPGPRQAGADPAVPGPYRHRPAGEGPQAVTVEDSFSMVHASNGQLKPLSRQMRSEPAIIAGIAAATLGNHPVDWHWLVADYDRIRDLIADTIPASPTSTSACASGRFLPGQQRRRRKWNTATGAPTSANLLPDSLVDERTRATGCRT
jgi:anaerobic selenocysteine-containing dehydrogenase